MSGTPVFDGEPGLSHALLGHDLRAALAEMRSSLHLLSALDLPEESRAALDRCRAVGDTLNRMIDQSVLVCLGQGSPVSHALETVNTAVFLAALNQRWSGRASESGHSFKLIIAGALPEFFSIDRTALERVLANLIGNCLVHTPPGPISLTLKGSGGDLLLISVEDWGPGFPAAHLAAIQRDFALPAEARREGGGFGLQSVKLLVEAMGGRCNARNKAGGGTEVGICLPLTPVDNASSAALSSSLAMAPDLTGTRLLLAEDNPSCRELARALINALGAHLTLVENGDQVMAALANDPLPDTLILDDEMPGTTGRQVLHWLRARGGAFARLPVLALTSHIGADEVAALKQAGANEVLSKPVLCPLELGRAILRAQGTYSPATAQPPAIDLSALKRLGQLAGPAAAAELFQRLEEDLGTARAGLTSAIGASDMAGIRAHSHVIIALAGTAGAMELHDDAVTLNGMAHANRPMERVIALGETLDAGLVALLQSVRAATLSDFGGVPVT